MSAKIVQLLPAPQGLCLIYGDENEHVEPAACIALVNRGTEQSVEPVEVADGELLLAMENPSFKGCRWIETHPSIAQKQE